MLKMSESSDDDYTLKKYIEKSKETGLITAQEVSQRPSSSRLSKSRNTSETESKSIAVNKNINNSSKKSPKLKALQKLPQKSHQEILKNSRESRRIKNDDKSEKSTADSTKISESTKQIDSEYMSDTSVKSSKNKQNRITQSLLDADNTSNTSDCNEIKKLSTHKTYIKYIKIHPQNIATSRLSKEKNKFANNISTKTRKSLRRRNLAKLELQSDIQKESADDVVSSGVETFKSVDLLSELSREAEASIISLESQDHQLQLSEEKLKKQQPSKEELLTEIHQEDTELHTDISQNLQTYQLSDELPDPKSQEDKLSSEEEKLESDLIYKQTTESATDLMIVTDLSSINDSLPVIDLIPATEIMPITPIIPMTYQIIPTEGITSKSTESNTLSQSSNNDIISPEKYSKNLSESLRNLEVQASSNAVEDVLLTDPPIIDAQSIVPISQKITQKSSNLSVQSSKISKPIPKLIELSLNSASPSFDSKSEEKSENSKNLDLSKNDKKPPSDSHATNDQKSETNLSTSQKSSMDLNDLKLSSQIIIEELKQSYSNCISSTSHQFKINNRRSSQYLEESKPINRRRHSTYERRKLISDPSKDDPKMKVDAQKFLSDGFNLLCKPSGAEKIIQKKTATDTLDDFWKRKRSARPSLSSQMSEPHTKNYSVPSLDVKQSLNVYSIAKAVPVKIMTENELLDSPVICETVHSPKSTDEDQNIVKEAPDTLESLNASNVESPMPIMSISIENLMSNAEKLMSVSQQLLDEYKSQPELSIAEVTNVKNLQKSICQQKIMADHQDIMSREKLKELSSNLRLQTKITIYENFAHENYEMEAENLRCAHDSNVESNSLNSSLKSYADDSENLSFAHEDTQRNRDEFKLMQEILLSIETQRKKIDAKDQLQDHEINSNFKNILPLEQESTNTSSDLGTTKSQGDLLEESNGKRLQIELSTLEDSNQHKDSSISILKLSEVEEKSSQIKTSCKKSENSNLQTNSIEMCEELKFENSLIHPREDQNLKSTSQLENLNTSNDLNESSKNSSMIIRTPRTSLRLEQKNSNSSEKKTLEEKAQSIKEKKDGTQSKISLKKSDNKSLSSNTTQKHPQKNIKVHNLRTRLTKRLTEGQRSYSESSPTNTSKKLKPQLTSWSLKKSKSIDLLALSKTLQESSKTSEKCDLITAQCTSPTNLLSKRETHDDLENNSKTDTITPVSTNVENKINDKCTETIDEFTQKLKEVNDLIEMEKSKIYKSYAVKTATENITQAQETETSAVENKKAVDKCSETVDKNKKVLVLSVETVNISPIKIDEIIAKIRTGSSNIGTIYFESAGNVLKSGEESKEKVGEEILEKPEGCDEQLNISIEHIENEIIVQKTEHKSSIFDETSNSTESKSFNLPQKPSEEQIVDHIQHRNKRMTTSKRKQSKDEPRIKTAGKKQKIESQKYAADIQNTPLIDGSKDQTDAEIQKLKKQKVIEEKSSVEKVQPIPSISTQNSEEFDYLDDENDALVIDIQEENDEASQKIEKSTKLSSKPHNTPLNSQISKVVSQKPSSIESTSFNLNLQNSTSQQHPQYDEVKECLSKSKISADSSKPSKPSHHKSKKATENWTAIPTGPSSLRITKTIIPNLRESKKSIKNRRQSTLPSDAPGVFKKIDKINEIQRSISLQESVTFEAKTKKSSGTSQESKEISSILKSHANDELPTALEYQGTSNTNVQKYSSSYSKQIEFQSNAKKNPNKPVIYSKSLANYTTMVRSHTMTADKTKADESIPFKESSNSKEFSNYAKDLFYEPITTESHTSAKPMMTRQRSVSLDSRQFEKIDKNAEIECSRVEKDAADIRKEDSSPKNANYLTISTISVPEQSTNQTIQSTTQNLKNSVDLIDNFGNIMSVDAYRQSLIKTTPAVGLKKKFIYNDGSEMIIDDVGNVRRKNSDPDVIIEILDNSKDPEPIIDLDNIPDDPPTESKTPADTERVAVPESTKFAHPDGDLEHLLTDQLHVLPNNTQISSKIESIQKSIANETSLSQQSGLMQNSATNSSLQRQTSTSISLEAPVVPQNNFKIPQCIQTSPSSIISANSAPNQYFHRKGHLVTQTVTSKTATEINKIQHNTEFSSNAQQSLSKSAAKEFLIEKLKKKLNRMQKARQIQESSISQTTSCPQDSSDDSEYENMPELIEIDDSLTDDELNFILSNRKRCHAAQPQKALSCEEIIGKIEHLLTKISGVSDSLSQQRQHQVDASHLTEPLPSNLEFENLEEILKVITESIEKKNTEEQSSSGQQKTIENKIIIHPTYDTPKSRKNRNKNSMVRIFRVTDVVDDSHNTEANQPITKQHLIVVPTSNQVNLPQFLPIPTQNINMTQRLMEYPKDSQLTKVSSQTRQKDQSHKTYTFIDHDNEVLIIENNPPQLVTSKQVHEILTNRGQDINTAQNKLVLHHHIAPPDQPLVQKVYQNQSEVNHLSFTNVIKDQLNLNPQNNRQMPSLSQRSDSSCQKSAQNNIYGAQSTQNELNQIQRPQCFKNLEQDRYKNLHDQILQHPGLSQRFPSKDPQMTNQTNQMIGITNQNANNLPQMLPLHQNFHEYSYSSVPESQNQPPGLRVLSRELINQKIDLMKRKAQDLSTNSEATSVSRSKVAKIPKLSTLAVQQQQQPNVPKPNQQSNVGSTLQPSDTMSFSQSLKAIAQKVHDKEVASSIGGQNTEVIVLDEHAKDDQQALLSEEAEISKILANISAEQQLVSTPIDMIPPLVPLQAVMPTQMNTEITSNKKSNKNLKKDMIKQAKQFMKANKNIRNLYKQEKVNRPIPTLSIIPNQRHFEDDLMLHLPKTTEMNAPDFDVDLSGVLNDKATPAKKRPGRPRKVKDFVPVKTYAKRGRPRKVPITEPNEKNRSSKDIGLITKLGMNIQSNSIIQKNQTSSSVNELPFLCPSSENVKHEAEVSIHANPPKELTFRSILKYDSNSLILSDIKSTAESIDHPSDVDEDIKIVEDEINSSIQENSVIVEEKESLDQTDDDHILEIDQQNVEFEPKEQHLEANMSSVPITLSESLTTVESQNKSSESVQFEEVDQNLMENEIYTADHLTSVIDTDLDNILSDSEDITPFYPVLPDVCVTLKRLTDEEIALAMSSIKRLESTSIYHNFADTYSDILDSKGISTQEAIKNRKRSVSLDEQKFIPKRPNFAVKSTFSSSAVKTVANVQQVESNSDDSDNSLSIERHRLGPEFYYEDPDYSPARTHLKKQETHQIVRPSDLDKFCHRDSDEDEEDDDMDIYGSDAYGTRIPTVSKMSQRSHKNYLSTIRTNETAEASAEICIEVSDEETEADSYSKSDDERIMKMIIVNKNNLIPKEKSILAKKSKKDLKRKVSFYNSVFVRTFLSEDD